MTESERKRITSHQHDHACRSREMICGRGFLCQQPARHHTDIWVMLISVSLGAVQPWSHFRGLFISVVPHFSSLICIKGPRRPLTPHASVSEGMCLPDVASFEPPTAKVSKQLCEASVDGSTQSLLAEVFGKKTLCVTVGIFIYAQLYDMCVTAVFVIPCSGFKYQQNQLTRISRSRE